MSSGLKWWFVLIYYYGIIKIIQLFEKSGFFYKELIAKLTGLEKTVRAIYGIRAIQVRAREVPLYTGLTCFKFLLGSGSENWFYVLCSNL
jgi:hypothetical protein